MKITPVKNYSNAISLNDLKEHLMVLGNEWDGQITRAYKASIAMIEGMIHRDIVQTTNVLEDFKFNGFCYTIPKSDITISEVAITNNYFDGTPVTTVVTGYSLIESNQFTTLVFKQSITADKIKITFTSGYSQIPIAIVQAVQLQTGYFFDIDRSNFITTNGQITNTVQRLIAPYINLY